MPDPARRTVLQLLAGGGLLTAGLTACGSGGSSSAPISGGGSGGGSTGPSDRAGSGRTFGAEWDEHTRTFMCWPATDAIWGDQLPGVREDIARLAKAIGATEPVVMLARPDQVDSAQQAAGNDVEVIPIAVDDLWARDTLPVFLTADHALRGVDFNFNGWGNKQEHADDALVAREVLAKYGIARDQTWIVAEGGSFETDGLGTLMITESSVVNERRNPNKTKQQIEDELKRVLGVTEVIWFAGVLGQDITDAHVDSLARFTATGVVLLDKAFPGSPPDVWSRSSDQARAVLADAVDARGKPIEVIDLPQPDPDEITGQGDSFLSSYVNFYVGNEAVFVPEFGDAKADDAAQQILQEHFAKRDIVPVKIDNIASGGGGIHCSTHDQPAT